MAAKPFYDFKKHVAKTTEDATMYALRETGRHIIERGRAGAPVYPGSQNQSQYPDARAQADAGALRRSIHNGKVIMRADGYYSLKVGPMAKVTREKGHGARGAVLYAQQMERLYGYMAAAVKSADLRAEYQKALSVGYGKYR